MQAPIWQDVVRALALVLVLEGLWPFLSPQGWRNALLRISTVDERVLRTIGLASMICGLVILQVV